MTAKTATRVLGAYILKWKVVVAGKECKVFVVVLVVVRVDLVVKMKEYHSAQAIHVLFILPIMDSFILTCTEY